jgi:hypothetical protein
VGRGPKPKLPKPLDLLPLRAKLPRLGKSSGTSSRSPASWGATFSNEEVKDSEGLYFSKIKSYGNIMKYMICISNA